MDVFFYLFMKKYRIMGENAEKVKVSKIKCYQWFCSFVGLVSEDNFSVALKFLLAYICKYESKIYECTNIKMDGEESKN